MKQTQALNDELVRAAAMKDELISELARIQTRQRDVTAQVETTEDQVKRTETMYKQIEQRRGQLVFSEKKVVLVEAKMAELSEKAGGLDQRIKGILERQAVVGAVKIEVDSVHKISARSRADLQFVTGHLDELAAVRSQVNDLLATAQETEEKIVVIEGRRTAVDEVQAKTNLISNLLDDVTVNLETLGEQKSMIESTDRENGSDRLYHAGGPEHAPDAEARARAGRTDGAEHQTASDENREGRPPTQIGDRLAFSRRPLGSENPGHRFAARQRGWRGTRFVGTRRCKRGRCCMDTRSGWGGVARTSRDPPQEPHYGDEVEGSSQV